MHRFVSDLWREPTKSGGGAVRFHAACIRVRIFGKLMPAMPQLPTP